ncbi:hypothetical protein P4B35_17510 [Pontiellaceae bacterium B12227]|nr:hypothetical protein [Pontiellaceae bacterium B12227]
MKLGSKLLALGILFICSQGIAGSNTEKIADHLDEVFPDAVADVKIKMTSNRHDSSEAEAYWKNFRASMAEAIENDWDKKSVKEFLKTPSAQSLQLFAEPLIRAWNKTEEKFPIDKKPIEAKHIRQILDAKLKPSFIAYAKNVFLDKGKNVPKNVIDQFTEEDYEKATGLWWNEVATYATPIILSKTTETQIFAGMTELVLPESRLEEMLKDYYTTDKYKIEFQPFFDVMNTAPAECMEPALNYLRERRAEIEKQLEL